MWKETESILNVWPSSKKIPDIPIDPFWKYLFRYRNESALHSLQEYLQQFQLSSHVRIAAIKK